MYYIYLWLIFHVYIIVSVRCFNKRYDSTFASTSKLFTNIPLCESLKPESITKETSCMSSCVTSKNDEKIQCNPQAETWKLRLKIDELSSFTSNEGCKSGEQRYKCVSYESNEGECDDSSLLTYHSGYSCFTKCGVSTCPNELFQRPNNKADLKVADCPSGYRTRCTIQSESPANSGNLTLELLKY